MNMKKTAQYFILIIVIIIAGVLFANVITSKTREFGLPVATAEIKSFDIRVNTIGVLDAERSHMVSSSIKGDKGKIIYLIDDGSMVKKGDLLIRFDPTPFEDEVLRLTGELRSKEAVVEAFTQVLEWDKSQAEGEISDAEFNAADAKQEYERYLAYINDLEDLGKRGFDYPTEIAQAKKKAEQLKANLSKTELKLEQVRKEMVFKVASAMAKLKKTKSEFETTKLSLEDAQNQLEKTIMHAPFPGIVVLHELYRDNQKRKPRVGDTVWQNQPLLYLPDISSMIIKTRVREVDLHKISRGLNGTVQVDAYPDALFEGEVSSIGVLATERLEGRGGEKYFQLTISLKSEDTRLRPGMTARVSIMTDNVKQALSVPVQAVFIEKGRKYCYVHSGESFRKAEVSVGRQNEDMAEILSGVQQGDKVCLIRPSPEEIQ